MVQNAEDLKVGETQIWPIQKTSNATSVTPDATAVLGVPPGHLVVASMEFQGHMQDFTAQVIEAGGKNVFGPGQTGGGPELMEIGSLKLNPMLALDTAAQLLVLGMEFGMITREQIETRFAQTPLKIRFE